MKIFFIINKKLNKKYINKDKLFKIISKLFIKMQAYLVNYYSKSLYYSLGKFEINFYNSLYIIK